MIGKSGNFFKDHYDWIAAGVALAVLAGGGFLLFQSTAMDADGLSSQKCDEVKRLSPGGEGVAKADLTSFKLASALAKNPKRIDVDVTDDKGSFLASEGRMLCTNAQCQAVVRTDVKACPACGAVLVASTPEETDADGDGLPNDWEKKFGLNVNDPADATADRDGDGFTNAEEYEANTDPTNAKSHPAHLNYVKLQLPLKETVLPFHFTGTLKTPSGLKYQFKDPSRAKEYDRGVYSVLAGEEIGKSGFVPKEYVSKTVEKTMGGGMKKKVDASEAIVVRKSDGKRVALPIGRRNVPVDVQAKLVYSRDGGKTFDVVTGDSITLGDEKYVIKEVKKAGKGASVLVQDVATGKPKDLGALEP